MAARMGLLRSPKVRAVLAIVTLVSLLTPIMLIAAPHKAAAPNGALTSTTESSLGKDAEFTYYDIDFSKKMLLHHQQGLAMADALLVASQESSVIGLAKRVRAYQETSERAYRQWLDENEEQYANLSDFTHADGHDLYPTSSGLLLAKEITALEQADTMTIDTMFYQLLHRHHKGGVAFIEESRRIAYPDLIKLTEQTKKQYSEILEQATE